GRQRLCPMEMPRGRRSYLIQLVAEGGRGWIVRLRILRMDLAQHLPEKVVLGDDRGSGGHLLGELLVAVGADVRQRELGGRPADVVITVAIDADGVSAVNALTQVPIVL